VSKEIANQVERALEGEPYRLPMLGMLRAVRRAYDKPQVEEEVAE
jgi:hypothetical protein